jgi:MscS family membrane protein
VEWVPQVMVETRLLGIALWQWAGLVALVAVAQALAVLLVRPGVPLLRWVLGRLAVDDSFVGNVTGPSRLLVALAAFRLGRIGLRLPPAAEPGIESVEKLVLVVAIAWLAIRLIDTLGTIARLSLFRQSETASLPIVELAQRALKITAAVFAALMLLEAVGVRVGALIAAIGVGGIGIALAAQRTVENLFGGLAVIGDQPVRVGDFCRFGDRQGTVERIGLWSTRVRTPERTIVSVPNAQFASMLIENVALRDAMLFEVKLPLRLDTSPDQVRWLLVRLRELLYAHPRVDGKPARVRLTGFSASALTVELFAYIRTADFEEYMAVREDLYLRIMEIVAAGGTALALPSQTTYGGADGIDPERARAAAAEVQKWREENRMPLPEFPPDRVKSLGGTLDYPPRGSADRP